MSNSVRKIFSTDNIDVYYDRDWKEYLVTPKGLKVGEANTYFTDDKQDAMGTARTMQYNKQYPCADKNYGKGKKAA